ncbi:phosphatase PAP2 family protein [Periweissella fabalis]|uniref:Phosphatase PAP2 family protein n=1 Tax=Periweissella fabalis TaxID=1070421 RepID=A0A7X6N3T0_9LACO|nr:phosphatase PAP2 family protein [Periweissella fabalis]MCM0599068.1 phosphatase PAP2 family protein [Periweissella fabalis]NKZ23348.1 phosphatase PAP2 family protein [Periweissella fabalis]
MKKIGLKIGISAVIFSILIVLVISKHTQSIDNFGFATIHGHLLGPDTPWMLEVTYAASPALWLGLINIIILYLFFVAKRQGRALYLALWLDGAIIIATVVKTIVGRPRPIHQLVLDHGYSFPSIHTLTATICVLMFLALFKTHNVKYYLFALVGVLWIVMVAASRVYLRNHYLTDVIGGATLAYLWTNILWYINYRWLRIIK